MHAETYEDDWHVVRAFDARDLLAERANVEEGLAGSDRVDHHEALPVLDVKVSHRRELLSARSIQNLKHRRVALHSACRAQKHTVEISAIL